jgi:rubredoxin
MNRWQCTVCGYIHEGDAPPDECPVCGAERSAFVPLAEEETATGSTFSVGATWRCTVCGHIQTGTAPPAECPVCGADRSQFVDHASGDTSAAAAPGSAGRDTGPEGSAASTSSAPSGRSTNQRRLYAVFRDLAFRYHFHPIAVHIPNGVVPLSVLFVSLGALFGSHPLGMAAGYNTAFVCLFMPVVLWSGYLHWKHRFRGALTRLFLTKIVCGGCLQVLALVCTIWFLMDPDIALQPPPGYVLCHLGMLGVGTVAGFLGGRLVFSRHKD